MSTASHPPFAFRPALLLGIGVLLLSGPAHAADPMPLPAPASASSASLPWNLHGQGEFVTALCRDTQGNQWVGAEDRGVWRYSPATQKWTQFTTKDGLGDDNAYSLACDRLGRVWVGTLNHGVSVWNGKAWRTYDQTSGPLGVHVTALAVCPIDGDVWGGTEAGLFRYSPAKGTWTYYTRANGLISDQVNCLAFAKNGDLYAGTMCDGLMMARAADSYRHWRTVSGWDPMPIAAAGAGLPSKLINAVLVSRAGDVYVGTTHGLAHSTDAGKTWRFLRGEDWLQQGNGLYQPAMLSPTTIKHPLLREEYVTSLAEDSVGNLYIGYRSRSYEIKNLAGQRLYPLPTNKPSQDDVTDILSLNGSVLLGTYGSGLKEAEALTDVLPQKAAYLAPSRSVPPLPTPAKPPSAAALQAMLTQVQALKPAPGLSGVYLGDDWQTQGDAIGHYGRQYSNFFAMQAPWGDHVPTKALGYTAYAEMGPHHARYDVLRHYVSWVRSDDQRALYNPIIGYRRQAEDDDHGESIQGQGFGGPDIWVSVTVAAGMHRVSLYFMNKDGHTSDNRNRDYLIELKSYAATLDKAEAGPTLARARVRDFWGGVYHSFLVRGPGKYYLKVGKNNSLNTIVSAVLIDKVQGSMGRFEDMQTTWLGKVRDDPPDPDAPTSIVTPPGAIVVSSVSTAPPLLLPPAVKAAKALWTALDNAYDKADGVALERPYRLLAYRAALQGGASEMLLTNWRWKLSLWTPKDKAQFDDTMAKAYQSLITLHPYLKSSIR